MKHIVYISVGSNIGNKISHCQAGIDALIESGQAVLTRQSGFYQTEPVDYTDQDWFINAVCQFETGLDPFQLLGLMKKIEQDAGRKEAPIRFGPRILDMDILLFDGAVIDSPDLTIPHAKMHKRCFVLKPLCDIDPDIVHPVLKQNVRYLLRSMDPDGQQVIACT